LRTKLLGCGSKASDFDNNFRISGPNVGEGKREMEGAFRDFPQFLRKIGGHCLN
jgi:hypothetical protein